MVTIGSLVGPVMVRWWGLRPSMVVSGCALAVFALAAMVPLRRVDVIVSQPPPHLALVESVAELGVLPRMSLERLARVLRSRELDDGEMVMGEGERADSFAIVLEGVLEVRQSGSPVRLLGPGDGFGEVGLLMGTPRTASVVACGPATVLWLDAETFVAAVTGHRLASVTALGVASGHLADDRRRHSPEET